MFLFQECKSPVRRVCSWTRSQDCRVGPSYLVQRLRNGVQAILVKLLCLLRWVGGRRGSRGRSDCRWCHLGLGLRQGRRFVSSTIDSCTIFVLRVKDPWLSLLKAAPISIPKAARNDMRQNWIFLSLHLWVGKVFGVQNLSCYENADVWVMIDERSSEGQGVKSIPIWFSRYSAYFCFACINQIDYKTKSQTQVKYKYDHA